MDSPASAYAVPLAWSAPRPSLVHQANPHLASEPALPMPVSHQPSRTAARPLPGGLVSFSLCAPQHLQGVPVSSTALPTWLTCLTPLLASVGIMRRFISHLRVPSAFQQRKGWWVCEGQKRAEPRLSGPPLPYRACQNFPHLPATLSGPRGPGDSHVSGEA